MFRTVLNTVLISFISIFATTQVYAQTEPPVLPDVIAASDKGINVISWTCQYDGIKTIAVQRSADSVFNYTTIGYVKNIKKGTQAFIDGHPQPGANWYRLYIAFSSDLTWYSNNIKVMVDSATILEKGVIPPNDSLQKYASTVQINPEDIIASTLEPAAPTVGNVTPVQRPALNSDGTTVATKPTAKLNLNLPKDDEVNQFTYVKSRHVFTNPFTGHVTLELPDDMREPYAIKFYKQGDEKTPVLEVPRLRKAKVIIDKHNFQGKGMYKFVLFKGTVQIEEGYISIF